FVSVASERSVTCMKTRSSLLPYTSLFRSRISAVYHLVQHFFLIHQWRHPNGFGLAEFRTLYFGSHRNGAEGFADQVEFLIVSSLDRKSTRLNSSYVKF